MKNRYLIWPMSYSIKNTSSILNIIKINKMDNKKIVFQAPNEVAVVNTDETFNLGSNEVLVKNRYSLISPGTELACLSGKESWFELPNTPGYIGCGEVIEIGDEIDNLNSGDIVFTYGPHAKYYKIDTSDRYGGMCIKVPAGLDQDLVPFTRTASIAMTAIRNSKIELGDWVAVTGMGIVGNFAAQLAQLQGARVIGIDINPSRLELAQKSGINYQVNSSEQNWKEKINEITQGEGVSTLIDATGLSAVITQAMDIVAPYGETLLLGSPRAPFETNVTDIYNKIHLPNFVNLKGALEWRFPSFKNEFVKHSLERNSEIILDLIKDQKLKTDALYTHKVKPEGAPEAYKGLQEKPDNFIGVVIDWSE